VRRALRHLLLLSVAFAAGCACDRASEAADLAGSGATDCGFAEEGRDRTPIITCLDAALAENRAAYGGWGEFGIDSHLEKYFSTTGTQGFTIRYDSDPSGGGGDNPSVIVDRCTGDLTYYPDVEVFGCPLVEDSYRCD